MSRLVLVAVPGGAAIVAQNPRFVMAGPSIVHLSVAAVMRRRGRIIRYPTPIARQNVPGSTMIAAGYAWAALMATLGLANLVFALYFDFPTWAWFVSVGAVGAKLGAFAIQYVVFRQTCTAVSRGRPHSRTIGVRTPPNA